IVRRTGGITLVDCCRGIPAASPPARRRGAFFAPGVCNFASLTPNRGVGGAPRDVRVLGGTPVGHAITRRTRRLRVALRPITRDARLSALHRGGFSPGAALPSPALPPDPSSELLAARS